MFVSSAGPKILEGGVLDLVHFGYVWIPPGVGLLGYPSGRCADPQRPQDQVVQLVEVLFILDVDFL